jgi:hypothetical protein
MTEHNTYPFFLFEPAISTLHKFMTLWDMRMYEELIPGAYQEGISQATGTINLMEHSSAEVNSIVHIKLSKEELRTHPRMIGKHNFPQG